VVNTRNRRSETRFEASISNSGQIHPCSLFGDLNSLETKLLIQQGTYSALWKLLASCWSFKVAGSSVLWRRRKLRLLWTASLLVRNFSATDGTAPEWCSWFMLTEVALANVLPYRFSLFTYGMKPAYPGRSYALMFEVGPPIQLSPRPLWFPSIRL